MSEDGPWANDIVSYTYQNRLRMGLSVQAPNASAWVENYGYDNARRLKSVTSPAGEFDYTLGGASSASPLISKLTLPNGAYITNTYDSVARLTSTKLLNSGSSVLDSYTYGYNQASQRTNVVRTAGDYVNYTYDNMGELTSALGKESGGVTNRWQEQFGYNYDAAGNLNYRTNNALVQSFNVNSLNELTVVNHSGTLTVAGTTTSPATNVTVNGASSVLYADSTFASTNQNVVNASLNTFTAIAKDIYGRMDTNTVNLFIPVHDNCVYDLNGNLISEWSAAGGTNRLFSYDDENELISVWVTNLWRTDFVYDGKMRRRIEKDFTWSSGAWLQTNEVHYIYDGNLVIQERDANNLPQVTYTRGNDLSGTLQGAGGIGGLLARTANPSTLISQPSTAHAYYHADGNGNITMLISSSQMIVAKYLYDPFGNTFAQSGLLADANLYRFSSKEWNANAGLYYYLYRFYDPNLQRWPNRDPLGERGFESLIGQRTSLLAGGPNRYIFVGDNPISDIDPMGLCNIKIRCGSVNLAGVTLGVHCGVIGPDGSEYGLGGGNRSSGSSGTANRYHLPPSNRNSDQTDYPVSCPNKSCDDVQKSLQNYHDTVTPPSYNALGPDSDTYAHNMLNAADCKVDPIPRPPCTFGGYGGSYGNPSSPTTTPPGTVGW